VPSHEIKAKFIEPMLLLSAETLPEGPGWSFELKLDGYRAIAIKTGGEVLLRSRNDKDFQREVSDDCESPHCHAGRDVDRWRGGRTQPAVRPSFNVL
jgi:ATP-dependent DNA ligase